jgi:hypothetical protein
MKLWPPKPGSTVKQVSVDEPYIGQERQAGDFGFTERPTFLPIDLTASIDANYPRLLAST